MACTLMDGPLAGSLRGRNDLHFDGWVRVGGRTGDLGVRGSVRASVDLARAAVADDPFDEWEAEPLAGYRLTAV
jgi:hypothetical protein